MDEDARLTISKELDTIPIKLGPSDCMPISRPGFAFRVRKNFTRCLAWNCGLRKNTFGQFDSRWGDSRFPGSALVGLGIMAALKTGSLLSWRQSKGMLLLLSRQVWTSPLLKWCRCGHRTPPYQYNPKYWLWHSVQPPRKRNLKEHEDIRCSLCGDSFAILPFAVMAAVLCQDFLPRMTPTMILGPLGLAPGATAHPSVRIPITRWPSYGEDPGRVFTEEELVKQLALSGVDRSSFKS